MANEEEMEPMPEDVEPMPEDEADMMDDGAMPEEGEALPEEMVGDTAAPEGIMLTPEELPLLDGMQAGDEITLVVDEVMDENVYRLSAK